MLQPKKQKFRKQFRGKMAGTSIRGSNVDYGEYGLKAMDRGWLSARQIEAARKAIVKYTHRGGKVWLRVFPDKPTTKKALGTRMGSGKGDIFQYVSVVRPGRILFEIAGVPGDVASKAFKNAGAKIPFKTKLVAK